MTDSDQKVIIREKLAKSKENLNLSGCNIDTVGLRYLSEVFKGNNSIVVLNLSRNSFTADDISILAGVLNNNSCLTTLYLCENNLDDTAANAISSLIVRTHISHLNLFSNRVGDEVAKAIANALANSQSLQKLYLQDNLISDSGALALLQMMRAKPLKVLNLSGNYISEETIAKLNGYGSLVELLDLGGQNRFTITNSKVPQTAQVKVLPLTAVNQNLLETKSSAVAPQSKSDRTLSKSGKKRLTRVASEKKLKTPKMSTKEEKMQAQIEYLRSKLQESEQKRNETENEMAHYKDQLQQLHVALNGAYELITNLQTKIKQHEK